MDGVRDIELNPLSGSALILYDSTRLSQDRLIETGCRWADWLDKAARGQQARCRPYRNDRHSGERLFAEQKLSPPGPSPQKLSGTGTGPRRCLVVRDIPA